MCPTFVTNETEDEEILFAAFGKVKKSQDPKKSYLVKAGESLTGVITKIDDSKVYKKIYRLKIEKEERAVVVLGTSDLNDKMGYGDKKVSHVAKVNDLVQITFEGMKQTNNGRPYYQFTVGFAK